MITFGPIPSRRLGKSLGINNIVSPKTCSYGCIYCQVGKTLKKSVVRRSFFEPELIYNKAVQHLESLDRNDYPDYLTFVSNGEPVLDINIGKSIVLLKKLGIPVAVITNASLLYDKSAREDLYMADWISLKMDASENRTWQKINRPSTKLKYRKHIDSILLFADEYKGKLHTETMIVDGLNDTIKNFSELAKIIKIINPLKAYLSVPTRPPAEPNVKAPGIEKLNLAWQFYTRMNINTEFLTAFEGTETGFTGNIYEDILNITSVHPLREDSLLQLLEKDDASFSVVESLICQKLIKSVFYEGQRFYLREYHLEN